MIQQHATNDNEANILIYLRNEFKQLLRYEIQYPWRNNLHRTPIDHELHQKQFNIVLDFTQI